MALAVVHTPKAGARLTGTEYEAADHHVITGLPWVDVRDHGAVGNGVANDTVAFQAAIDEAIDAGGGTVLIPAGTWRIRSRLTLGSNLTIAGVGMASSIVKWDPSAGGNLFYNASDDDPLEDLEFANLAIEGCHGDAGDYTTADEYPLIIYGCTGLRIRSVQVSKSRVMGIVARDCFDVSVSDCVVRYCARDGINVADCDYYDVSHNLIEFCDDDAIAAHSQIYGVADRGGVISGNTVRFAQGIKVLGARSLSVTGNTVEFFMGQGISVNTAAYAGGSEGRQATVGVTITGNILKNAVDRAIVDALNTTAPYITISAASAQAGSEDAIPGEVVTADGSVVDLYGYMQGLSGTGTDSNTAPIPGNYAITISGNTFVRDIPAGISISDLGFGTFYVRTGPDDPTLTDAALRQTGINLTGGPIRGLVVSGNTFMGIGPAVAIAATGTVHDSLFSNNVIYDCTRLLSVNASNTNHHGLMFIDNIVDIDPLFASANRGASGTWQAETDPTAMLIQNAFGFSIAGNRFRNTCRVTDLNLNAVSVLQATKLQVLPGNTVDCQPAAVGFSTSNKGIGNLPRAGIVVRVVDSDPGSATYGTVLNHCPTAAPAIPTAGVFVAGHVVQNVAPAVAGAGGSQYVITGWVRLTTGNAHVLDTDWAQMRTLTGT